MKSFKVFVPVSVIYVVVQRFYVACSRQLRRIESKLKAPIYSNFQETIQEQVQGSPGDHHRNRSQFRVAVPVSGPVRGPILTNRFESEMEGQSSIRAFGRIEEFEKSNHELMDQFHKAYYMTIVCNRWMSIRLDLLNNLIVLSSCIFAVLGWVLAFLLVGFKLISHWWTQSGREQLDAGLVGLCITYALSLTRFLNFLIRQLAQVEANIVSVERVETYLNVSMFISSPQITIETDVNLGHWCPSCVWGYLSGNYPRLALAWAWPKAWKD